MANTRVGPTERQGRAAKRPRIARAIGDIHDIIQEMSFSGREVVVLTKARHEEINKVMRALDKFRLGHINDSQLRSAYREYMINTMPISRRG